MSLIHQALKKLEGERAGGAIRRDYAFRGGSNSISSRALLIIPVIIGAVAAFFFLTPSNTRNTAVTAPQAAVQPATPATPSRPSAEELNRKGMEQYSLGRLEEAATAFKEASGIEPGAAFIHNNIGLSSMRLGKRQDAEAAFKKAIALEPGYTEARNNYASLLISSGSLKKAQVLLEEALKSNPGYADAHFNLAVLLEKRGDLAGAIGHYEAFLNKDGKADGEKVKKKIMELRSALILKEARGW
ncbi:MAG TPA: hypothetical protein DDW94_03165 [Deltaproteobacteria bacterium]|nr:MAG: hypothetical protein A2Z79_09860 [Deltaproteobacteria bacterium GWA2_55_82]OGQ62495.1 MAG: hypothetical protein A3I81_08415 [Deltaproteobacteria bacterium RIFCSPLOWO2_02_FULL_55_12]OIJ73022.1 MAG: hypothetical protein A2V21_301350 [Deltaproteobacteria bacterium GWC2_55_46]HBG45968.1 hypothetical protein [Deltaproteobacteria bacterium]HCY11813.1 hypothetical protein [Deltaproteobacteria bacterium]